MAIRALSAAFTACAASGWTLTNLELQKLLYLAHMTYLGRHQRPLISEGFEAWDYGPVLPSLYQLTRVFGGDRITALPGSARVVESREHEVVREVVVHFRGYTPGQLVDLTHREGGAWARSYRPHVRNIPIPNTAILEEYEHFTR